MRELLEARSGVYHPALYETPDMAKARPPRGSHAPGISCAIAATVSLPEGKFLAEGAGGQYALVAPTLDLVVVGYDPGPDASIGAATGERPKG